jgi:ribosome maturation factor RimP
LDHADRIEKLIAPTITDMGYELVRVSILGGEHSTLQIMAERADGTMNVEGCEEISRAVSAILDVEDPIEEAYDLQVSSPGIDRPLTRLKDFERWSGFEAKVELDEAVDGQRRYRGKLLGLQDTSIKLINAESEELLLPFEKVRKAKLVLTDELISASQSAIKS